jgi:hypothetical protein
MFDESFYLSLGVKAVDKSRPFRVAFIIRFYNPKGG